MANLLKVDFEDGTTKYLKSNWVEKMTNAFSPEKTKNRASTLFLMGRNMWVGSKIEITEDGTVIVNDSDKFTSEELWRNGKDHIDQL